MTIIPDTQCMVYLPTLYHRNEPNLGKYIIHWVSGNGGPAEIQWFQVLKDNVRSINCMLVALGIEVPKKSTPFGFGGVPIIWNQQDMYISVCTVYYIIWYYIYVHIGVYIYIYVYQYIEYSYTHTVHIRSHDPALTSMLSRDGWDPQASLCDLHHGILTMLPTSPKNKVK